MRYKLSAKERKNRIEEAKRGWATTDTMTKGEYTAWRQRELKKKQDESKKVREKLSAKEKKKAEKEIQKRERAMKIEQEKKGSRFLVVLILMVITIIAILILKYVFNAFG